MGHRLTRNNLGFYRRNERERLMFIAAAGLAFSLLIIMVVVLNYKSEGLASQDATVRSETALQPAIGSVSLLTLERPVPAGTKLSDVPMKEVFWPKNQIPTGALFDASEVRNMYAKVDMQPGVPIQREQLTTEQTQFTLPLQPGFRAISIEVDATSGLEGHAQPGTRVDVLLTYYQEKTLLTEVLVQNARVLSYAGNVQNYERSRPIGARQIGRTMTLEVTPKDALKIQNAKRLGTLSLMMRPTSDNGTVPVTELTQEQMRPSSARKPEDPSRCSKKGRVKVAGREFMVECDGTIRQSADGE